MHTVPLPPHTRCHAPTPSVCRFGVDVGVDYYALSFVRDARVIYELKNFLAQRGECVCGWWWGGVFVSVGGRWASVSGRAVLAGACGRVGGQASG